MTRYTAHDYDAPAGLVEEVARAIYEAHFDGMERNPNWPTRETHPETPRQASLCHEAFSKDEYREHARAALAIVRAHCLARVREINSRGHLMDSDAECEARSQRALVARQLAEDFNACAQGAGGDDA